MSRLQHKRHLVLLSCSCNHQINSCMWWWHSCGYVWFSCSFSHQHGMLGQQSSRLQQRSQEEVLVRCLHPMWYCRPPAFFVLLWSALAHWAWVGQWLPPVAGGGKTPCATSAGQSHTVVTSVVTVVHYQTLCFISAWGKTKMAGKMVAWWGFGRAQTLCQAEIWGVLVHGRNWFHQWEFFFLWSC